MEFTYDSYIALLRLLKKTGYSVKGYFEENYDEQCVVLRHDIDYSIKKALRIAKIEECEGVSSTYFVLMTSDMYNPMSQKSKDYIKQIMLMGHEIGLHFDEGAYSDCSDENIASLIIQEARLLSEIINSEIRVVSMHRPSEKTLSSNYKIPGMVNSYGKNFFEEFKYLSDSRMRWREPVEDIIKEKRFNKLHILTHSFWYEYKSENMRSKIMNFLSEAGVDRYDTMHDNFTDLQDIVKRREIEL